MTTCNHTNSTSNHAFLDCPTCNPEVRSPRQLAYEAYDSFPKFPSHNQVFREECVGKIEAAIIKYAEMKENK